MNRWDLLVIAGLLIISAGAALIYPPAGLIVLGVGLVALGIVGSLIDAGARPPAQGGKP